jgi:hypothetical protein
VHCPYSHPCPNSQGAFHTAWGCSSLPYLPTCTLLIAFKPSTAFANVPSLVASLLPHVYQVFENSTCCTEKCLWLHTLHALLAQPNPQQLPQPSHEMPDAQLHVACNPHLNADVIILSFKTYIAPAMRFGAELRSQPTKKEEQVAS